MTLQTTDLSIALPLDGACQPCAERLRAALARRAGIGAIAVDDRRARLKVTYDADRLSAPEVQALADRAAADLARTIGHATLTLTGLDCADCAATVERGVRALPGVLSASASFMASTLAVEYTAGALEPAQIERRIGELGYGVARPAGAPAGVGGVCRLDFAVTGMDCAGCAATIERTVARLPGVRLASVNFMAATLTVAADAAAGALPEAIRCAVGDAGYQATPAAMAARRTSVQAQSWWRHARLLPTAVAALLWTVAFGLGLLDAPVLVVDGLYAAAIAVGGYRIARTSIRALVHARLVGIDLLMTIAVVGAALIGEWTEGAAVVVLFALGEALEGLTADRARHAIRALMDLSPRTANRKTAAGEERVPVEALAPGDVIVIRPGEQVGADGRVVAGATTINQAAITGESLPAAKAVGAEVFAGTLNERGAVEVEVTRRAEDTTLAKIIHLVEEAQATKAPAQRFVDRFARLYTPAVIAVAALVAAVPPLLGEPFVPWLYRALTLLVIACPCALVISTPVAIVAGIARASRAGVLIKGGAHLEALGSIRAVAFDKTGTLTEGRPAVTDVLPLDGRTADAVLALAAAVESRSEHPLAGAIVASARARGLSWPTPDDFAALSGRGARATVGEHAVVVGNSTLFPDIGDGVRSSLAALQTAGKTALLVGVDGQAIGIIAVADRVRPGADRVVADLKAAGLRAVAMLTGDNGRTAAAVAGQLGIDEVRADVLPDQKLAAVQALLAEHGRVAMVGDGVNDAPALATATVGIAMGAAGSDTALETADVALMTDDLTRLPFVIRLSRAALGTIRVNVGFALAIKAVFLALTLAGLANLWLAILADTGAALLVIANSMRLLHFPQIGNRGDAGGAGTEYDAPRGRRSQRV